MKEPRLVKLPGDKAAMAFLHPCSVCGKWAPFGEGYSAKQGKLGVWYCAEHQPQPKRKDLFG